MKVAVVATPEELLPSDILAQEADSEWWLHRPMEWIAVSIQRRGWNTGNNRAIHIWNS